MSVAALIPHDFRDRRFRGERNRLLYLGQGGERHLRVVLGLHQRAGTWAHPAFTMAELTIYPAGRRRWPAAKTVRLRTPVFAGRRAFVQAQAYRGVMYVLLVGVEPA